MAKRKHYSLGPMVLMFTIGSVFIAVGIGVLLALIASVARTEIDVSLIFIIVPLVLFVLIPITFGSIALRMAIKPLYHLIHEKRTLKSGTETTASIIDYKAVSHNGRLNRRFALKLAYTWNNASKTFTTDYVFDINELKYLKSLHQIKIKVAGNFAAVAEPFPDNIYQIVPRYEIPIAFFQQPFVAKTLRIFWRLCPIMIIGLLLAVVLTVALHNSLYLTVGAITFVVFNVPFALILAVCLIQWLRRKR